MRICDVHNLWNEMRNAAAAANCSAHEIHWDGIEIDWYDSEEGSASETLFNWNNILSSYIILYDFRSYIHFWCSGVYEFGLERVHLLILVQCESFIFKFLLFAAARFSFSLCRLWLWLLSCREMEQARGFLLMCHVCDYFFIRFLVSRSFIVNDWKDEGRRCWLLCVFLLDF